MKNKISRSIFYFSFLVLLSIPIFSYSQSVSINSTYRFTPDGDAIVFRIRVLANADVIAIDSVQTKLATIGYSQPLVFSQNTITKILVGEYSNVSSARVSLGLLQQSGFSDAFIIETTLSAKDLVQKGIPVTPSIYQQDISNATNTGLSDSALWNQTMAYYSSGSTITAERYFAQLIKQYPNSSIIPTAKYYLGSIFFNRYFYKAINKTDQYGQWEYLRSAHLVFNDIVTHYSTDTIVPLAQLQLGLCKQAMAHFGAGYVNKMTEAVNTLKKSADTQTGTDDNAKAKAQLMYCNYLFELGANNKVSWDTVRFELAKVKNYPNANRAYASRSMAMSAETYYFEMDYFQMMDCATAALTEYPDVVGDVALNHYLVGRAFLEMRDNKAAQSEFDQLLANYGDSTIADPIVSLCRSGALMGKAICYMKSNDTTNFQSVFNQLITNYPNSQDAQAAKKRWGNSVKTIPMIMVENPPIPVPGSDIILTQVRDKQ